MYQVSWWDLRVGEEPVCSSPADWSHAEPVCGAVWTNCKTHMEVLTTSYDSAGNWDSIGKKFTRLFGSA
jgi:hypothetical protein